MYKKLSLTLVILTFVCLFAGCSASDEKKDGLSVISTIFAPYDFARNICPEGTAVSMLLSPGVDIHSYEPTPKDVVAVQNCDLFIYVGGESDAWVETLLSSMENVRTLRLMDCVSVVDEEIVEGMEEEEEEEGEEAEADEHVWTSPENAMAITKAISEALVSLAPDKKAETEEKTNAYLEKLSELDGYISGIVSSASRSSVIFADRFPMRYFTDAYGLSYYAAFPGCASNTEPSASVVAFLIDKINESGIPAVFYTEFSNQKMADTICESTGAVKLRMHSCHNVSQEDFEKGTGYIELMYENAEALKTALN